MRVHKNGLSAFAVSIAISAPVAYSADGPLCPTEDSQLLTPVSPASSDEEPDRITIFADEVELVREGDSILRGDVEVKRGDKSVHADQARYNLETQRLSVSGDVSYRDSAVSITSDRGSFQQETETGTLTEPSFTLVTGQGRGHAEEITTSADQVLTLRGVTYTTCPADAETWQLIAKEFEIDNVAGRAKGRGVKLKFGGVPLIYLPYGSFPIRDERKTGVLTPDLSLSERSGTSIRLPVYVNLAPNRDLTITPRWMSERGVQLQSEFRYLTPGSWGNLYTEYLNNDDKTDTNREFVSYRHQTNFHNGWTFDADLNDVSDSNYFEDFGVSTFDTSQVYLQRELVTRFRETYWQLLARVQALQTVDDTIPPAGLPYRRVPQLAVQGDWPILDTGLSFTMLGELVSFDRDNSVTGVRLDMWPQLRYRLQQPGYYLEPKLGWRFTQDELNDVAPGSETSPSFNAPVFSFDSGARFERYTDRRNLQTLEPRVLYTYIPFREQQDLPIFDTSLADFNEVQLFREDRFVGGDRLGDTNQLAVGLTSRLLSLDDGRQVLGLTFGQALFFEDREVGLTQNQPQTSTTSDFIAEGDMEFSENWSADLQLRYDPDTSKITKTGALVRFRPSEDTTLNLGYRFRDNRLEQSDVAFALPLRERWRLIGRWNYSLDDSRSLDRLFGVDYETCCWSIHAGWRRFLISRDGQEDRTIFFQLQLKGLTSLGQRAEGYLERGILTY